MKRFHVSLSVEDVDKSAQFYTTLFNQEPAVRKDDYAKWMLDDPRLNFSVSSLTEGAGVDHIGLQADTMEELDRDRIKNFYEAYAGNLGPERLVC